MSENPITAWVDSIPDLPTDPTRRAMVIALRAVEMEIEQRKLEAQAFGFDCTDELGCFQRLSAARIALTDALFPSDSIDARRSQAIQRLRHYVTMRDAQPTHQTADTIHGVHLGTEWSAELLLSDLRLALEILP